MIADRQGHITVFNVGPTGNLNLLYPPDPAHADAESAILAHQPLHVHDVQMTPPAGRERLFAVWSRRRLALRLEQLLSLIGEREEDRGESRPYVATRDMKRVRAAVQQL